jgi:hypothetical protein
MKFSIVLPLAVYIYSTILLLLGLVYAVYKYSIQCGENLLSL